MDKSGELQMTWREAVEFLLRVARSGDPEKLREGDLLNLNDDFRRFLEVEGSGKVAKQLADAKTKPGILRPAIDVVQRLAYAAADHARVEIDVGSTSLIFDGTRLDGDRVPVFSDGLLKDVVADIAASDLGEAESWQIGRCQWRECSTLFLADRKGQTFCSHKCASFASSERYQQRQKSKRGRK